MYLLSIFFSLQVFSRSGLNTIYRHQLICIFAPKVFCEFHIYTSVYRMFNVLFYILWFKIDAYSMITPHTSPESRLSSTTTYKPSPTTTNTLTSTLCPFFTKSVSTPFSHFIKQALFQPQFFPVVFFFPQFFFWGFKLAVMLHWVYAGSMCFL